MLAKSAVLCWNMFLEMNIVCPNINFKFSFFREFEALCKWVVNRYKSKVNLWLLRLPDSHIYYKCPFPSTTCSKAPIYTNITVRLQIKWVISLEWVYYDTIQPSGAQVFPSGIPDKAGKHSPPTV